MRAAPDAATSVQIGARWSWVTLTLIVLTSIYTDVSRLENPDGEKYLVDYYYGGQADFTYAYLGARAWLAGENPYTTPLPQFTHRWFPPELIDGRWYKQLYPPGHIVTDLPLALYFKEDQAAAGRFFFRLSLACLALLSFLTWRIAQRLRGESVSPWFAFAAMAALTFQPGVQLGLERGQIDIIVATMCWAAVLLAVEGWIGTALFLCLWGTSVKGYPVLFGVGLGLSALRAGTWKRALAGTFLGIAVFILPAISFLRDSLAGTLHRSGNMYISIWWNQGFKSVVEHVVSLEASDRGRAILNGFALLVSFLCGALAWWNRKKLADSNATLSWTLYAVASLLLMVGYSKQSVPYNQILILPGVLLLAANQDRIAALTQLSNVGAHALGLSITVASYALFLVRWNPNFPLGGLGMVMLLPILAALAVVALYRARLQVRERGDARSEVGPVATLP